MKGTTRRGRRWHWKPVSTLLWILAAVAAGFGNGWLCFVLAFLATIELEWTR